MPVQSDEKSATRVVPVSENLSFKPQDEIPWVLFPVRVHDIAPEFLVHERGGCRLRHCANIAPPRLPYRGHFGAEAAVGAPTVDVGIASFRCRDAGVDPLDGFGSAMKNRHGSSNAHRWRPGACTGATGQGVRGVPGRFQVVTVPYRLILTSGDCPGGVPVARHRPDLGLPPATECTAGQRIAAASESLIGQVVALKRMLSRVDVCVELCCSGGSLPCRGCNQHTSLPQRLALLLGFTASINPE